MLFLCFSLLIFVIEFFIYSDSLFGFITWSSNSGDLKIDPKIEKVVKRLRKQKRIQSQLPKDSSPGIQIAMELEISNSDSKTRNNG